MLAESDETEKRFADMDEEGSRSLGMIHQTVIGIPFLFDDLLTNNPLIDV